VLEMSNQAWQRKWWLARKPQKPQSLNMYKRLNSLIKYGEIRDYETQYFGN